MKKLIYIGFLFCFNSAFSQRIEYPKLEEDSLGQKIVIMTIEQAQKLDNDTDLLVMFEGLNQVIGTYDSTCIKSINKKDKIISDQTEQITNLKTTIGVKDSKVSEKENEIKAKESEIFTYKKEIENKNSEIDLRIKENNSIKWMYGIGGIISGGFFGTFVGLICGILITK